MMPYGSRSTIHGHQSVRHLKIGLQMFCKLIASTMPEMVTNVLAPVDTVNSNLSRQEWKGSRLTELTELYTTGAGKFSRLHFAHVHICSCVLYRCDKGHSRRQVSQRRHKIVHVCHVF